MDSKAPRGEPPRPSLETSLTVIAWVSGGVLGGACASYAAGIAAAQIWDGGQDLMASKWCFVSYAGTSLTLSSLWVLSFGGDKVEGKWAGLLGFHVLGCLLAVPCAFVGCFLGKFVGAIVGVFTASFGRTWLDDTVATSGKGCVIGAAVGVALPWLLFLNMPGFLERPTTPATATDTSTAKDIGDAVD